LTELAPGRGSVLKPVTESVSFDKTYAPQEVADVAAAIAAAGDWLRETQKVKLVAVGHRGRRELAAKTDEGPL
jgi:hypothetical protein